MEIKIYKGCAVSNQNGIYSGQKFAEWYGDLITDRDVYNILSEGPDNEGYFEVLSELFPLVSGHHVYEYNEDGDILIYMLIDSDKITVGEIEENSERIGTYECQYGYTEVIRIGENCLTTCSVCNIGIHAVDNFFEIDNFFSLDENLQSFYKVVEGALKEEFLRDYDIFVLPAFYAAALINTDESGLKDSEIQALNEFLKENTKDICVGCSEGSFFTRWHDMSGSIDPCDCLEFYFRKGK